MGDPALPTRELAADATVQAADKLNRSAPNQLDVDYMKMLENIAKYSPAIDLATNTAGSHGRRMYAVLGGDPLPHLPANTSMGHNAPQP